VSPVQRLKATGALALCAHQTFSAHLRPAKIHCVSNVPDLWMASTAWETNATITPTAQTTTATTTSATGALLRLVTCAMGRRALRIRSVPLAAASTASASLAGGTRASSAAPTPVTSARTAAPAPATMALAYPAQMWMAHAAMEIGVSLTRSALHARASTTYASLVGRRKGSFAMGTHATKTFNVRLELVWIMNARCAEEKGYSVMERLVTKMIVVLRIPAWKESANLALYLKEMLVMVPLAKSLKIALPKTAFPAAANHVLPP